MCGRFTHRFTWRQLHRLMTLTAWPEAELKPRFNVAPTQLAPVVLLNDRGERIGDLLRWGLVPSWADDERIGSRMINARAETVADRPAFLTALKRRRCLVPTSGFYEWRTPAAGAGPKQPFWIGRRDREPLVFAGLWEEWTKGPEPLRTFTILTTAANELVRPLHDRMPVVIEPADFGAWLDPDADPAPLLRTHAADDLECHPVSTRVNNPRNDDPSLLDPAPESEPPPDEPGSLWG